MNTYNHEPAFKILIYMLKYLGGSGSMHLPDLNVAKKREKKENKYIELNEDIKKVFNNKKYFLRTYGCQMNVHDSEAIRSYLERLGLINTENIEEANVIVLNTCAIRENARDKVVGFLGKCHYLKKNRNDVKIVLAGCMAEQPDFVDLIQKKYSFVDIIIYQNYLFNNLINWK